MKRIWSNWFGGYESFRGLSIVGELQQMQHVRVFLFQHNFPRFFGYVLKTAADFGIKSQSIPFQLMFSNTRIEYSINSWLPTLVKRGEMVLHSTHLRGAILSNERLITSKLVFIHHVIIVRHTFKHRIRARNWFKLELRRRRELVRYQDLVSRLLLFRIVLPFDVSFSQSIQFTISLSVMRSLTRPTQESHPSRACRRTWAQGG
jgi:hypothetical protein